MNDDAILILLLLITAIVLWLLVFGPKVKEARAEAEEAAKLADEAAPPELSEAYDDIYFEIDHRTEAARHGRYFFND